VSNSNVSRAAADIAETASRAPNAQSEPEPAACSERAAIKYIRIEVTVQELLLVTTLMSDQLFRREFIDPKMPGSKLDPEELAMGKDLVLRLRSMVRGVSESAGSLSRRAPSHLSSGPNGNPNAV
jgi:hypothetical protein